MMTIMSFVLFSQTTYLYQLTSNFKGQPVTAPDLIQIPNNDGLTGSFVERNVPASTCGQQGTAGGYFFNDDSGLQFNNPEGFIDQSYSLAFNFQVDEFITPPQWVRILSFTHTDDVGVYILLTDPPAHGTLEFWPYGTVGQDDFFTTVDFYQIILVRNETGLIKIYVNGQEFAEYDDSQTHAYVPQEPNHYIVFFRDDPSVLANEASPGFVSDIMIADYAWTVEQVQGVWAAFCSSLLDINEFVDESITLYPNPAIDKLCVELPADIKKTEITMYDLSGRTLLFIPAEDQKEMIDVSAIQPGIYIIQVKTGDITKYLKFTKE
jgi:hypothetical protein